MLAWRSWRAVSAYLLGPHFQLGLQLAAGIVLTSLPVFVRCGAVHECGPGHGPPASVTTTNPLCVFVRGRALRFPHACFTSVLMVIGLVSMSPDGAIGTKLLAAYQLVGQAWLGALTAGAMVRHAARCLVAAGLTGGSPRQELQLVEDSSSSLRKRM